jgi:hypothetical protein
MRRKLCRIIWIGSISPADSTLYKPGTGEITIAAGNSGCSSWTNRMNYKGCGKGHHGFTPTSSPRKPGEGYIAAIYVIVKSGSAMLNTTARTRRWA